MAATVSAADFWNLLLSSRLLSAEHLQTLRKEFENGWAESRTGDADAVAIATWLGKQNVLTAWQARQLLRGRGSQFFLGDYRLREQHKTPFRGRLFSATHEPSGRDVSIVVLESDACKDPAAWNAIVEATQRATQVTDPAVSKTWALEQAGKRSLIVCEPLLGIPLSERFSKTGSRPLAETGALMFAIARGVAELHRLGIVHGAISLHTIWETEPRRASADTTAPVRLLQFPLAGDPHLLPPQLPRDATQREALGQRICFIAPELATPGVTATATSDVYSLGCVLAALLTGQLPNWDGTVSGTLARAEQHGLTSLPTTGLPKEVTTAIGYMTARDPLDRYASAVEAAAAVAACFGLPEFPLDPPAKAPVATEGPVAGMRLNEPAGRSTSSRRRRAAANRSKRWQTLLIAAVAITVVAGTAVVGIWRGFGPRQDDETVVSNSDNNEPTEGETGDEGTANNEPTPTGRRQELVDDETLPWASPTTGIPPSLNYLPQGSQCVLLAKPAELLADDEGQRVVEALGPEVEQLLLQAETLTGLPRNQLTEVRVGWGTTAEGTPSIGVVLVTSAPLEKDGSGTWHKGAARDVDGETVYDAAGMHTWLPTAEEGRVLVVAPQVAIEESIAAEGMPLLSPDFERLLAMLDEERHLTLMVSPSFLRNDGQLFLSKQLTPPATAVADLLGEPTTAAALSLFLGDTTCYLEIDAVPVTAEPPRRLVDAVAARVSELPDEVEEHCLSLAGGGYGGRLIGRLPGMLRVVAAELRWGIEDGLAVLNVYLPREAAHNILLASELALAQESGAVTAVAVVTEEPAPPPQTVEDKLAQQVSLVFAKDTLERSIEMLAADSGIPMEILGGDLQLEGITKNQSFGLDAKNQSVDAILRTILEKANPDGKLVYVIRGEGDTASLAITTRAAVAKRGEPLPPGF